MALPRILALVLAGGAGSRLELLTERRAKAAVPFAGVYRLVDFPLTNCQHSLLTDVWVTTQFHPTSLSEHLANGRPWDLDRTTGGLMVMHPSRGGGEEREGWHTGTADSLFRLAPLVRDHAPDVLLVLSADAVYRLDYRDVVDTHLGAGRAATMVTTEVREDEAGRYGVVQVDGDRVRSYAYKPDDPVGTTVANEVLAFDPVEVLDRLESLADDAGDGSLDDLGDALLPGLTDDGEVTAHPLEGYWRDVGTVEAYWQAHRDFLADDPPLDLDDPAWSVRTRGGRRSAARVLAGASVEHSLLSGGCRVAGDVRRSVLSPGVEVAAGAVVEDSVLLPGVRVAAGAVVRRAVVDDGVVVDREARVGERDGDIALVGRAVRVERGTRVGAGGRLPEPEEGR